MTLNYRCNIISEVSKFHSLLRIIVGINALAFNGLGLDAARVPRTLGRECPDALSTATLRPLCPCEPSMRSSSYCDAAIAHNYTQRKPKILFDKTYFVQVFCVFLIEKLRSFVCVNKLLLVILRRLTLWLF